MNAFQIKILAIITMIIDHVGLFFFPGATIMRMIGRISFPLFAWLIANGAYHTHNQGNYLARLYVFALLSQIPFWLTNQYFDPGFTLLNVLFTLFFGLLAITLIQQTTAKWLWILITALFALAAQWLNTDYGAFGVIMVVLCYVFFNKIPWLALSLLLLFLLVFQYADVIQANPFEAIGLLAIIPIGLYNNQPGPKAKYLFYLFYPLQYVVYYLFLIHD